MSYTLPAYLAVPALADPQIRYVWDDSRASDDFTRSSDAVIDKFLLCTPRAQIVAGIGIFEWVLWRFHRLSDDPLPFHLAEAAWCASIDPRYMKDVELPRSDWLGPVRGPLWCAVTWLVPMLLYGHERPEEYDSGLRYLSRLALHVLPRAEPFAAWLDRAAERLLHYHPAQPVDPFAGLFDPGDPELRGALVGREALDPNQAYAPAQAAGSLSRLLREVDRQGNPLLASPEEMLRNDFSGVPYTLDG
jgi:hypothetical protein